MKNAVLQKFFAVGSILVVVSLIAELYAAWGSCHRKIGTMTGFGLGGLLFFCLLIYTLFFALLFEETYCEENKLDQRMFLRQEILREDIENQLCLIADEMEKRIANEREKNYINELTESEFMTFCCICMECISPQTVIEEIRKELPRNFSMTGTVI